MISSLRMAVERTASINVRSYGMLKQAKKLKKMIDRMSEKKKPSKFSPVLLTKSSQQSAYTNDGTTKRLTILNKVYMEEILLMLNGGVCKSQLSNLGVQITKVKMAKGLNFLNIHWITLNKDVDEDRINEVLMKALKELQEEMGSIRFTSKVPLLKFVRDKRLENELQLEEIFQSADFGKNFKPVYKSKVFTPDFVHKDMKFPEMRQDVLGLDHAKIKESIQDKILKFKAINIEWIDEKEEKENPLPEKLIVFTQKDFYKFYKRRRIMELKMKKKLGSKYSANVGFEDAFEELTQEEDDQDDFENFDKFSLNEDDDDDDVDEEDNQDYR